MAWNLPVWSTKEGQGLFGFLSWFACLNVIIFMSFPFSLGANSWNHTKLFFHCAMPWNLHLQRLFSLSCAVEVQTYTWCFTPNKWTFWFTIPIRIQKMGGQHHRVDRLEADRATPWESWRIERDGGNWLPGHRWCPHGQPDCGICKKTNTPHSTVEDWIKLEKMKLNEPKLGSTFLLHKSDGKSSLPIPMTRRPIGLTENRLCPF